MIPNNRVTLILLAMSVIVFYGIPFSAVCIGPSSALAQGGAMGSGPTTRGGSGERGDRGGRGGPGGGGQTLPGMPSWGPYTPSEGEITRVMNALRMRDPNKAKELEAIRKTTPQFFMSELRQTPEYNNLMATRIDNVRFSRRSDFIKWLEQYVPDVANELNRLRITSPELYVSRYEIAWQRYSSVFDKSQTYSDPNYSKNLVADLELEEQQYRLQMQMWGMRNPRIPTDQRNELESQLREVVRSRYDINVQQQKIEYEQLLSQLAGLQLLIQTKLEDLNRWGDPNEKSKEVERRMQYLTRPMRGIGGGGPGPGRGGGGGGPAGGGGRGGGGR